jgi:hypothetical protein
MREEGKGNVPRTELLTRAALGQLVKDVKIALARLLIAHT